MSLTTNSTILLDAKFKIVALDQSSTPLSEAIKRTNLVNLLPVLAQLGVPNNTIKEELIRIYDFPQSFLETPPTPPQQQSMPQAPSGPPMETQGVGDIGAQGELPAQQLAQELLSRK